MHRNELDVGEMARALDAPPHPAGNQQICLRAKGKARAKTLKPNEATIAIVAYVCCNVEVRNSPMLCHPEI